MASGGSAQLLARLARAGAGSLLSRQGLRSWQALPCSQVAARHFAGPAELKKTPLYDFHVEHSGKMVPFAGWSMPIQYKDSIMESTIWCREHASLFDVSHMLGLTFKGKDAIAFLEMLVVGDIAALQPGTGSLSVFTNEKGGIIDDTVITKVSDEEVYLVVNAGCVEKDLAHINKHLDKYKGSGGAVELEVHDDRALLALQGPAAVAVLQGMVAIDLSKLYFSGFVKGDISGVPSFITRTGYTGEDGFELSIPGDRALEIAQQLVAHPEVRLCGLGPRDSLRLEAGLCLYGNDLTEEITPVEAGLTWTIAKSRREDCAFLGGEVIKKQLAEGVKTRRVGFVCTGAPARAHSEIQTPEGETIGEITSGAFSPVLKKNVAMGYVQKAYAKSGTELKVMVRGKANDAVVTKMPFVPTAYYKAPTTAT